MLKNVKVVVALGKIAFDGYLRWLTRHCEEAQNVPTRQSSNVMRLLRRNKVAPRNDIFRKKDFKFFHGATYESKDLPHILIASYHPSRQNTQTGKLTVKMFRDVFIKSLKHVKYKQA